MAGRSGDGVELNVFVLRRATRSKRKSPSNRVNWNSATRRVARLARGAKRGWRGREYGRGVGWGRGQETEENAVEGGGMAEESSSSNGTAPEEGIFTAIFSTTYPQIPCPNL